MTTKLLLMFAQLYYSFSLQCFHMNKNGMSKPTTCKGYCASISALIAHGHKAEVNYCIPDKMCLATLSNYALAQMGANICRGLSQSTEEGTITRCRAAVCQADNCNDYNFRSSQSLNDCQIAQCADAPCYMSGGARKVTEARMSASPTTEHGSAGSTATPPSFSELVTKKDTVEPTKQSVTVITVKPPATEQAKGGTHSKQHVPIITSEMEASTTPTVTPDTHVATIETENPETEVTPKLKTENPETPQPETEQFFEKSETAKPSDVRFAADETSSPALDISSTKPKKPTTPAKEPTTPAKEPTTPAKKPTTEAKKPTTPAKKPTTPAKEPTTPAKKPTTQAKKPTTQAKKPTSRPKKYTTKPQIIPVETEFKKEITDPKKEITDPKKEITDPKKEITDPVKEITDPVKEITDPKKEITDPKKEITDPKKEITDPVKEITDPKKEITDPKKEITDPKKEITYPVKEITDPVKEITDPKKEITDPKKEITDPKKEITDPKKEITDPIKEITEAAVTGTNEPAELHKPVSTEGILSTTAELADKSKTTTPPFGIPTDKDKDTEYVVITRHLNTRFMSNEVTQVPVKETYPKGIMSNDVLEITNARADKVDSGSPALLTVQHQLCVVLITVLLLT